MYGITPCPFIGGRKLALEREISQAEMSVLRPGLNKLASWKALAWAMCLRMLDLSVFPPPSITSGAFSLVQRCLMVRDSCQGARAGSGFGNASLLYSLIRSQSDNSSDLGT